MLTQPPRGHNSTPGLKRTFPRTDSGNAELFAAKYTHELRYDHSRQRWLVWRQHWWSEDKDETVIRMAKSAVRSRFLACSHIEDKDDREEEVKWARNSEQRSRIEAMLRLARAECPLSDGGEDWDTDAYLLGVANGVIDLRTGTLRPGRQSDKLTLHSNIQFDPRATAPRWEQFLIETFEGDEELINYTQRAAGYSLTGDVREQRLFVCEGLGANGKSTFLKVLLYVSGDYGTNLPFSAFELRSRSKIPNDVADTAGRRLVTALETSESEHLNEARIKLLTGGDSVTARRLYREHFTFRPTAKIWLAFNHRPRVSDDSLGFWRRVDTIPFPHEFGEDEADLALSATLEREAPGILAWMVRGCMQWQDIGLCTPERVKAATAQYRIDSDPLAEFMTERCEVHSSALVEAGILWRNYLDWMEGNRDGNPVSRKLFSRMLDTRGFKKVRFGHDRTWTWVGIGLRADSQMPREAIPLHRCGRMRT